MKEELKPQPITLDQFKTMPDVTDEVTKAVYQVAKEITEKEDAFIIDTIYPWCTMQTAEIRKEDLKDAIRQWKRPARWIEEAGEYYHAVNEKGGGVTVETDYFTDDIACSECLAKFSVIDNETERFKYCPNCGRRMENAE